MQEVCVDENNNRILGVKPDLINTVIQFEGKNNILVCEEEMKIVDSRIKFYGDNSIVYLAPPKSRYFLNISLFHNCVLFIDDHISLNGNLNFSLSEEKNVIIGRDCLFAFGIWIRLANPHLIYSAKDKQRISLTESIFIGDHVWVGQASLILKGTQIGSGSIIAGKSVVPNKKILSNSLWGGNPVRKIKDDVFFNKQTSNPFTKKTAKKFQTHEGDEWIYKNEGEVLSFNEIDERLSSTWDLDDKLELLISIRNNKSHNRFYME